MNKLNTELWFTIRIWNIVVLYLDGRDRNVTILFLFSTTTMRTLLAANFNVYYLWCNRVQFSMLLANAAHDILLTSKPSVRTLPWTFSWYYTWKQQAFEDREEKKTSHLLMAASERAYCAFSVSRTNNHDGQHTHYIHEFFISLWTIDARFTFVWIGFIASIRFDSLHLTHRTYIMQHSIIDEQNRTACYWLSFNSISVLDETKK